MVTKEKLSHNEPPVEEHLPAALQQSTSLTVGSDYGADAGAGMEDLSSDELLIPFIRILQSNSPQCDEASGGYNPEARPGMIICTATQQLYDGKAGMLFVPVRRSHTYPEFVPRDSGGGFVGVWNADDPRIPALKAEQGAFTKLRLQSGNELVETFSLFGLSVPLLDGKPAGDAELIQGVVGFSSTQIKAYKQIVTRLTGLLGSPKPRYPMFAFAWVLKTVAQKNKKGSFYGWSAGLFGGSPTTALLPSTDPLYLQARSFSELVKSGAAKADYAQSGAAVDDGEQGDENIPF